MKTLFFGMSGLVLIVLSLAMSNGLRGGIGANPSPDGDPWLAPKEADQLKNPFAGNKNALKEGEKSFGKICWQCHGTLGLGDGPAAEALDPKPSNLSDPVVQKQSDGALVWKITTGRGSMQSYKELLSVEDRWKLVSYIRELGGAK